MKYKIGQEILVKEDFEICTIISNNPMIVKEGDKGYVDSKGFLHLISGEGGGKIINVEGMEVANYHHENISKMIFNRLNSYFNLGEILENEDIDIGRFKEEIEDVLMDIL